MGDILYDKTLGLEVEADELRNYNPNLVKTKGSKQFVLNKNKNSFSDIETSRSYIDSDPTLQEHVGQYFAKDNLYDNYLEREDINPSDLDDLNEVQYRNQTTGEAWRNGFTSRLLSIAPKVANLPGVVGGLLVSAGDIIKDAIDPNEEVDLAKSMDYTFNNFWVNAMSNVDEGFKSLMPVFGSKYGYYSDSLLDNLHSAKFWAEDALDGVAFTLSAMAPGLGWMKALTAMSKAEVGAGFFTKAAGFMKFGKTANQLAELPAEKLIELGINRTSQFLTATTNVLNESALEAHDYSKTLNKDEYIANRLKGDPRLKRILELEARLESMPPDALDVEGLVVSEKTKLDMQIQKEKFDLKKSLEEDFIKEKQSGALGVFLANAAILTVPDFIQSKLMHNAFGKSSKLFKNDIRTSADKAIKTGLTKAFAKTAGIGIASEGLWEENSQTAVQDYYKQKANSSIDLKDSQSKGLIDLIGGTIDNMTNNVETLLGISDTPNNEGAKAIILGAATGGLSSGLFGISSQIRENKVADIADKDWALTRGMAQSAMTSFLDRFNKVTDSSGKLSMTDMIKAFTYSMNNKNIIDSQNMALLLDNEIMHNLGVNDELAKEFFKTISQVDGKKYLNNQEALELLKHNLNEKKNSEGIDEASIALIDKFISKMDSLNDNWNKSNQIVEETTKGANDTTKEYKSLLAKTLFFGLNKQAEINEILKDGSISKSQKQIDALSDLNREYGEITSKFSSIDHINLIVDRLHKEANVHKELQKEIKDEKSKKPEDRDNLKIKTLEYQLEELAEINGWINESDKIKSYNWGQDGFKMSLAPTDIINRASLGIRDQFFYDMGRSALSLNNVDNLINGDNIDPSDIKNFIESEDFHYISKENKDKLISKYKSVNQEKINNFNAEKKIIEDDFDITNPVATTQQVQALRNKYGYENDPVDDSDAVGKLLDKKFAEKDNERNEFLGREENASSESYITNIRKRIAKAFLNRMKNLNLMINENLDSYSNEDELLSSINSINSRIEIFENSDTHKKLIPGYIKKLQLIRDELQKKIEVVAKNKNNKSDLDNKLEGFKNKSVGIALGFEVVGGKINILNAELYNKLKSICGDVLWNEFEKNVITEGMELDSIFFDKLVVNLDSDSKIKLIEAIDNEIKSKSNEVSIRYSINEANVGNKSGEAKKFNNTIKGFLNNPLTSAISLFVRVGGNTPLFFADGSKTTVVFVNSKGNLKNISDRFLLHGNLELLLEESLAIAANGSPVLMNENPNLTREMYEDTISLIRSAIELKSMADIKQQLESNVSRKDVLKAEVELSKTQLLAPSKQQRRIIKSVLTWLFTDKYNELNGFSGSKLINGLAGTGKTTVVASTIFKILNKISKLDVNKNVVVLGPNINVATNMSDSIGKAKDSTVSTISDFTAPQFTVSQDVRYIVIDEIGTLNQIKLTELEAKLRAINSDRIKNGKPALKVLMFGDPNQVQDSVNKELPSVVRSTNTAGNLTATSEIETTDVLSVQYRSDIDAINAVADAFAGRQYRVSGISAKANVPVSDFTEKNPNGVHAAKSTSDFIQRLKFAIANNRGEKVVVAYNTNQELKEVQSTLSADELSKVSLMHYKDIQGMTLTSLFVNVKESEEFKTAKYKFNSILYMLSSRPKEYLCINDYSGIFDNILDNISMNASSDRNKTQMAENVGNYKRRVEIENSILNGKKVEPKKTEPKVKPIEPKEPKEPTGEVGVDEEIITPEVTIVTQSEESEFEDLKEDEITEDEVQEIKSRIKPEVVQIEANEVPEEITGEEKPTSVKVANPSGKQFKTLGLKAGDELFVLGTGSYDDNTRKYVLVKKVGDRYFEVGVLSESELKSLGVDESMFNKSFETDLQKQETGYELKSEKTFASINGNPVKITVDKSSSLKIEYSKENQIGGNGFLNNIISKVVSAISGTVTKKSTYKAEIFLPTELNMKQAPGNKYSHLNLQLGVPYLMVKTNGVTTYIRLEPKKFNKETSWYLSSGENAFELFESFKNGVRVIGDYFESIGINARFGSLDFRNFIYAIAGKSSKIISIDRTNNDTLIPRDLKFESFEEISDNKIHVETLKKVFGSNIDAFNNLINDEFLRTQLLNVVKSHFNVVNDEKQNSPKQLIEDGDEYGFAESYENFINIVSGLLSTTDNITDDVVKDIYGIEDEDIIKDIVSRVNEFKGRKNINKTTLEKLLQATIEAFDNNSLFPENSSDKIVFEGINKEDVQKIRDIFKLVLKASPIKSEKNGNTYQWLAEDKSEKGSKKHLITLSDGKTTNIVSTKRLSSRGSKIQKIFNYIARSNKTINGKNFRKFNSKTKTTKTGYAVNSVNVFWENDERNNESMPEELRDFHYDHTAESYNEELAKEMITNNDYDGLRAMTESYTINEFDLDEIANGAARRQITREDVKNANSGDMSEMERYIESGFQDIESSSLYVSNESKLEQQKSKESTLKQDETINISNDLIKEKSNNENPEITDVEDVDLSDIDNEFLLEKDEDSSKRLGKEIAQEDALKYLKKIIPSANEKTLRFLNKIRSQSKEAYGRFVAGVIELEKTGRKTVYRNVLRHEAFHKIWHEFLPLDVKRMIIESYLDTLTDEQIFEYEGMSYDKLEKLLEERIARKYQSYNENDDVSFMRTSLSKLKTLIRNIYNTLTNNRSELNHYFDLIDFGFFNKKLDQFDGIRNYNGIISDYKSLDNYIIAKDFVARWYDSYMHNGSSKANIPLSQQEINGAIIARATMVVAKADEIISKNKEAYENDTISDELKITYEKALEKRIALGILIHRTKNGSYRNFEKMMDELLPGRKDNSI